MILYLDMVAYEDKLLVQKKIMNLKSNGFNLYNRILGSRTSNENSNK